MAAFTSLAQLPAQTGAYSRQEHDFFLIHLLLYYSCKLILQVLSSTKLLTHCAFCASGHWFSSADLLSHTYGSLPKCTYQNQ